MRSCLILGRRTETSEHDRGLLRLRDGNKARHFPRQAGSRKTPPPFHMPLNHKETALLFGCFPESVSAHTPPNTKAQIEARLEIPSPRRASLRVMMNTS